MEMMFFQGQFYFALDVSAIAIDLQRKGPHKAASAEQCIVGKVHVALTWRKTLRSIPYLFLLKIVEYHHL